MRKERARKRKSKSKKWLWTASKFNNDNQEKNLSITSIHVKTDSPKEVFSFTPVVSPGVCLPDGIDISDPELLF